MADYFSQLSCMLDVETAENAERAEAIRGEFAADLDREEGSDPGFEMAVDPESGPGALWIHCDEQGEPEHVIRFVLRCAEALDLRGTWGFCWANTCSRPRLDGFGGGAQIVDLTNRTSRDWVDLAEWVVLRDDDQDSSADIDSSSRLSSVNDGEGGSTRTFLDCSSAHLSPATWTWLDTQLANDALRDPASEQSATVAGGKTRDGWFVYAPKKFAETVPDDLAVVLLRARDLGAEHVLFDAGAVPTADLPILHPDFGT